MNYDLNTWFYRKTNQDNSRTETLLYCDIAEWLINVITECRSTKKNSKLIILYLGSKYKCKYMKKNLIKKIAAVIKSSCLTENLPYKIETGNINDYY